MKLGLVGLPMSGKTTIFNALTGANRPASSAVPGKLDVQIQVVDVPDPRLDALHEMYPIAKKVQAKVTVADIAGVARGISSGGLSGPFRNQISQMDGLLVVLRVFDDPAVPHPEDSIDPQRDLEVLDGEFMLVDLVTVENRLTRLRDELSKGKDREANQHELDIFLRLHTALEAGQPLRDLNLAADEQAILRGYGFLSLKPRLVILNVGEDAPSPENIVRLTGAYTSALAIRGQLEAEISQLDAEEAALFLSEYSIDEPMRSRAIRAAYDILHVQTFFTIGDDEVRAWPVAIGATAQEAAGTIHTDFFKGFIRAEIASWQDLVEYGGMADLRKAGKLRLEGRDYLIQDGEVMTVRANV
jgi:hypothetical protein